ncbi:MAG: carbamoylphosphate synthase large subunit [Acidobacteriales bacterium 59-55]|nr:PRTRC system protein C [Terriglobales bacterium]OJV43582.1 MAG: carbamoylphosphate synthase large subunit [Acidobacteriales bacterium 59-55]
MSTLVVSPVRREFVYNGTSIPDPDPKMTPEQVRDTLVAVYPEIATATLSGPEPKADAVRYTFNRAIGSKG